MFERAWRSYHTPAREACPASAASPVGSAPSRRVQCQLSGRGTESASQKRERITMLQRQFGQLVINRIVESERADFDPLAFFPETTPEDWAPHKAWLQPRAMDPASGNLIFPMQSWLVRTRHHTILVDTCIG